MYGISHVEAIKENNKERKLAKKRKVRLVKARLFHIEFFQSGEIWPLLLPGCPPVEWGRLGLAPESQGKGEGG